MGNGERRHGFLYWNLHCCAGARVVCLHENKARLWSVDPAFLILLCLCGEGDGDAAAQSCLSPRRLGLSNVEEYESTSARLSLVFDFATNKHWRNQRFMSRLPRDKSELPRESSYFDQRHGYDVIASVR